MEKLVVFSGKMTSGKTTLANELVERCGFKRVAIGDLVRKISNALIEMPNGIAVVLGDKYNESKVVNKLTSLAYKRKGENFVKEGEVYRKNKSYRKLTQDTGDILRNAFGDNFWVNFFFDEIEKYVKEGVPVVCDDLRLISEYEKFKQNGFKVIRLEIEKEKQKERIINLYKEYSEEALTHRTETELDGANFDLTVDTTNESVEESISQVIQFLKKV